MEKKVIYQQKLEGERALFNSDNLKVVDCIFSNGESPLKESSNIELVNSSFHYKYPLWYTKNISAENCTWFDMARAGVWYTENVSLKNCAIDAPKNFRRCKNLKLEEISFSNAQETLWSCDQVKLKNVTAKGDYFGMNSSNIEIENFTLYGNYSFDGCKNLTIKNAKLLSKDAFWNSENVTVYDSFITGEYLGWNAKNLTLINCTISSLQGLCYIENLTLKNCKLLDTTLAFEYSTNIDAEVTSTIQSIINPSSGTIKAKAIKEIILESDKIDPSKTKIIVE